MSAMGDSMLASTALRQSSSEKFRKSPGGGPPAVLIRMSGSGQVGRRALRPSSVVTSQATGVGRVRVSFPISSAVASSASLPRAQIVRIAPSRARAVAQPLPNPLDAAQTMAFLPLMPRSMDAAPAFIVETARAYGCGRRLSIFAVNVVFGKVEAAASPLQPALSAEIEER